MSVKTRRGTEGTLLTATRNIEALERKKYQSQQTTKGKNALRFLDDKNYALSVANGLAFLQKYHTPESYVKLLTKYFENVDILKCDQQIILCSCTSPRQLDISMYEKYLEKELNIEYPNGYKHNKQTGLMNALIEKVADRYG